MEDRLQWLITAGCFAVTVLLEAEVAILFILSGTLGFLYYGRLFKDGGQRPLLALSPAGPRIAREVTIQTIIIEEILKHRKQLVINGKDYVKNPENKFTLTVLGAVAELERAKIIERATRGKQLRLSQGQLLGCGVHTFGYDYIKKTRRLATTDDHQRARGKDRQVRVRDLLRNADWAG